MLSTENGRGLRTSPAATMMAGSKAQEESDSRMGLGRNWGYWGRFGILKGGIQRGAAESMEWREIER
jgi:hypothetical protein